MLGAAWGQVHRTAPAHLHSTPSGALRWTCPGAPGARLAGDPSAPSRDVPRTDVWGTVAHPPHWPWLRLVPLGQVCLADGGPELWPAWPLGHREPVQLLFWATKRQDGKGQCLRPPVPCPFQAAPSCPKVGSEAPEQLFSGGRWNTGSDRGFGWCFLRCLKCLPQKAGRGAYVHSIGGIRGSQRVGNGPVPPSRERESQGDPIVWRQQPAQ